MRNLCKALAVLLAAAFWMPFSARAQSTCSNASLNGAYFYVLTGDYYLGSVGEYVPYEEEGKLIADGNGGISGQATSYLFGNNALGSTSLSGGYSVQGNCSGTMTLNTGSFAIQVISGGQSILLSPSSTNYGVSGQAYRAANASGGQCGTGSLIGTYSYVQSGGFVADANFDIGYYSEIGQITADGNGNITTTNVYNEGSGGTSETGSGTYTMNSDCSGTYQITYAGTTSPFTYAIGLGEGNNLVLMETDVSNAIGGTGVRQSAGSVLPQFVFGSNTWYSALYFTNSNNTSVSFTVNFIADAGTPLTVPSLGGSSVGVTLAPNGTSVLQAPNTGSFGEGYASVTLPPGVTGYGIFRQSVGGHNQEAVVPLVSSSSTTSTLAWDETSGAVDTVALANPSSVATNVTITVWDTSGNLIGTSPAIPLGASSKTEGTLDALFGQSLAGKQGSAQFSVSTGNVAVLGLRFLGIAFTSVPTSGN